MTPAEEHMEGSREPSAPKRSWWHYFRYEETPPLEYAQPKAPVPRWKRFGHLPLETMARIPPDQYPEMLRDAQLYTGRHWLPGVFAGGFGLLGIILVFVPAGGGWASLAISAGMLSFWAVHRAVMQSYLEGRLHDVP